MKLTTGPGRVEALAEEAVVAACTLADAADPSRWSAGAGAVEDVAAALEVLAGALAQLDPECAEILSVVPVAAAAIVERAEQAGAGTSESVGGTAAAGRRAALRQALTAHGLVRNHVHQLGAVLVTVPLDAPEAQALAVLLSRDDALPRQVQQGDHDGWGAGPAETAAAALADALRTHCTGAYARVLTSGQVSACLTPQAAQAVVASLTARPGAASRGKRRGLGSGFKGIAVR
ncbi:hypothetical protein [Streptomyces lateritius]|uniref:hypothetical protein n=1 Tax=Streptomyces lateritius TaxID=67313 RepID=UPI001672EACE|nr:hypothetical protein [Streptomyces lateritius]GGU11966.1 hypothetical protein GCM10010272_66430 [Streptomyces lateritius]